MDIVGIIKDNLPEGIEISDKAIKTIAKEISSQQGKEFIPMEQYSLKTKELGELSGEIADLKATVAGSGDFKEKYEAEKAAHDATKDGYATEKTTKAQNKALHAALIAAGASEKAASLMIDKIDREKAVFEGDIEKGFTVKNGDDIATPMKEQFGDFFGKVVTKGAEPASPPKGTEGKANNTHKDMNAFIRGVIE